MERQAWKEQRELKVQQVLLVFKGQREKLVQQARLVLLEQQDLKAQQDFKVLQARWAQLEKSAQLANLELRG
jgi:hypothetical protein